ncbi:MAG: SdpI family protein [Actinomycetota bacterium]|nr:SdpI family protein [Actinomycetota bacterium]
MGKLPRNPFAGIRIPSTMRSDEAWSAGHRAAASALTAAGVGPVAIAVIVGASRPRPETQRTVLRIANMWLVGWIGIAVLQARQAARTATPG